MLRYLAAVLYAGIKPSGDRSNTVLRRSYHLRCRWPYVPCWEFPSASQHRAGAISLARLFGNDLVAIDANAAGTAFLIVSRGGNYVLRAGLAATGRPIPGAPNVVRFQTGNLPNGVVISPDGRQAYANNEANVSITAMDLVTNTVLSRDTSAGEPPTPGTFEYHVLVGKLAFFTALGIPDDGFFDTP